jgi:predicted permease
MSAFLRDMHFGIRQLGKAPGFFITCILTFALGIGANTAVFSTLDALLLRMLPVRDPQHLFTLLLLNGGTQPPDTSGTGNGNTSFSFPVYQALRTQPPSLVEVAAHIPLGSGKVPVRYGATPAEEAGEEVSGNYFSLLGVPILRGTALGETDERDHTDRVVISYGFWTRAFSRAESALGQTLFIKGVPFTIVGITHPSFYGVDPANAVGFWIPLQTRVDLNAWGNPGDGGTLYNSPKWWAVPMVARLGNGVSPTQAQQRLQPVFWHAATIGLGTLDFKRWPASLGFSPIRGIENYAHHYSQQVEIMMVLVGLVLLIACTNVSLLILARNAARAREFAIRMAAGARPFAIFRQLLAESFLVVFTGAVLGWLIAIGATRALAVWAKIDTGLAPDHLVLLFTLVLASLVALAFSLIPLRSTLQLSIDQTLRSTNQGMSQSSRRIRSGNAAIALQIGMCFTLLVASGLTLRTLINYQHQDLGMQADDLVIFDLNPKGLSAKLQAWSFYDRLLQQIKAVPGVEAATVAQTRPGSGWLSSGGIRLDGTLLRSSSGAKAEINSNSVGADFFHTMGIPILEGRDLSSADVPGSPLVVVVNETFAREFLQTGSLGHHIDDGLQIVGVVKDSKYRSVTEPPMPTVYHAFAQVGMMGQATVEVRAVSHPLALLPQLQRVVRDLDPDLPLQNPMTQATQFEKSYVTPMLFARLTLGFGLLAVTLVATGLYGTLVYRLQRRRSEIGIRVALGALRGTVLWMILRESLLLCLGGFVVGLPLSLAVSRLLRSQLYHLSPLDPASFILAAIVTFLVAVSAALAPARTALRIDPLEVLRTE